MARMSAAERKRLPASAFVFPSERAFPVHDAAHAKAALILSGRKGSDVQKKVRAAVRRRYPNLVKGRREQ